MTNEELQAARRLLLTRQERIVARTGARLVHITEELDSREIEVNENARELQDAVEATELSAVERRMLAAIEDALTRIDNGSYGVCAECGEPIEAARLAAIPEATLCMDDAATVEAQASTALA